MEKDVAIVSAKYAAIATVVMILANVFLAPKFGYPKPTFDSLVILGVFEFFGAFLFLLLVFSILNRLNRDDDK